MPDWLLTIPRLAWSPVRWTVRRFRRHASTGKPSSVRARPTVPNWTVGETFLMAHGRRFRILEVRTELLPEVLEAGFNGIFVSSRLDLQTDTQR